MSKVSSCFWNIWLNGKKLDQYRKSCIGDIAIEEQCDGSDTCTLSVSDPDFLFIEDNIFVEEATISVEIGWHGETHNVKFDGYISAIDIDFPESGFPTLSIFCLDESHVMNRKKKSRSWDNTTNAVVVQKIAKEYGFKCVIQTGYTYRTEETISQSNMTDIEFCENLAGNERELFMCKLIGDTLYYVKKGIMEKEPSATLYYKKYPYDVVSFSPQINKETRQISTTADINTDNKDTDSSYGDLAESYDKNQTSDGGYTYNPTTGKWERK